MRILRIIGALVLVIAVYFGYRYFTDKRTAVIDAEQYKMAALISDISFAAEIYRNHQDSFFLARDSILESYGMTIDSIYAYKERLIDKDGQWAEIWDKVANITDSLVDDYMDEIREDSVESE
jgi:hypothetical protein